ncbi:YciI family protein [Pendulispora albinea]|uniref:YciI family protein n=1 Tax=Pendulispora albinea TaxID=2741071 RepID=A0ABZ2LWZ1_9BACT
MRFIITARRDDNAEPNEAPFDEELFVRYMRFNEELQKAGVLVAAEGLLPDAPGARVGVSGGKRKVLDGPFAESKELVGGFYIIDVPSLEEAKAWALRCPTGLGTDNTLEIRQLTGSSDIPKPLLDLASEVAPTWTATLAKR